MESASRIFWGLFIVVALVLVNAFFVAAEYALVRVRRTRMEALAAQGSSLARVVLHGLDHLSRYIAGVQVGITLAGLASGRFGEPVLAALFDPLFVRLFPPSLLGTEVSTFLATGLVLLGVPTGRGKPVDKLSANRSTIEDGQLRAMEPVLAIAFGLAMEDE